MNYTFPTIYPVACHTDNVGKGSTFVALPGTKTNGIEFLEAAILKGAAHVVVPSDARISTSLASLVHEHHVKLERADNIRERFAQLAAQGNGNPADQLTIIGITGTKGKTTSSFIVRHILAHAGYKTALLGTVHNQIDDTILPQALTTPHADYLHVFFAECVRQGVTHVVIEVSAQALSLARVHGIEFKGVIFTNFSQEHAEFYGTQDEYFAAKCKIFSQVHAGSPVVLNADDAWFGSFNQNVLDTLSVVTVGMDNPADCAIEVLHSSMEMGLVVRAGSTEITCPKLVGTFNAYNMSMVFVLCQLLGIEAHTIVEGMELFAGVKGRMQAYPLPNGALCIIDHAHTPSSFEAVLSTLRPHTTDLIVVFGIGGDRDTIKRPILGSIASQYGDKIVLTSDNPRSEDPVHIIEDIKKGIPGDLFDKIYVEVDRKAAIQYAYSISQPGSVIALLAKGSDEYQEIKGVKYPFVEREIIQQLQ